MGDLSNEHVITKEGEVVGDGVLVCEEELGVIVKASSLGKHYSSELRLCPMVGTWSSPTIGTRSSSSINVLKASNEFGLWVVFLLPTGLGCV